MTDRYSQNRPGRGTIVSRGNDLCVWNRVTQADEFRPSRRSDAYSLA